MSETLMVLRAASSLRQHWEWIPVSQHSTSPVKTAVTEEQIAASGVHDVCLLIPPEGTVYRELSLPNARYKLTPQTLQWLVEETLPDDNVPWHWTVVERKGLTIHVIGIHTMRLRHYLEPLQQAGINVTAVLPDGCYLPWTDKRWTLVNHSDYTLIRTDKHIFNELSPAWLPPLLTQYAPEQLLCYGDLPCQLPQGSEITRYDEASALTLFRLDDDVLRYNLLHGEFRPAKTPGVRSKWLRRMAFLCLALAIASFFGTRGIAFWQAYQLEQQFRQQRLATWAAYFPQEKRPHNFRFYFKRQEAQRFPAAVPLLQRLDTALQAYPDLHLTAATYSQTQKSLELRIVASNEESIKRFHQAVQSWFPLEEAQKSDTADVWIIRSKNRG